MYAFIKGRYRKFVSDFVGTDAYFYLNPASVSLMYALKPLIEKYCRGRLLDAGAGRGAWESLLKENCTKYTSLDIEDVTERGIDIIADIQSLKKIVDESFDTIFCSQVLEHVTKPDKALNEFFRIMKNNGVLILSVPHLSYLHNEPNDFYRYTIYGLRYMLEKAGFEIVYISPTGGLFSFLGFIPANVLLSIFYDVPLVNKVIIGICGIGSRIVFWIDSILERRKIFALNYVAVARKIIVNSRTSGE